MQLREQQFILAERLLAACFERLLGRFEPLTSLLCLYHPGPNLLQLDGSGFLRLIYRILLRDSGLQIFPRLRELREQRLVLRQRLVSGGFKRPIGRFEVLADLLCLRHPRL